MSAPAVLLAALACAAAFAAGCAPTASSPGEASSEMAHVAEVHRTKCGKCHERVEPGTRSRAELTKALAKHRSRVKLSEREWDTMVDYLAGSAAEDARAP